MSSTRTFAAVISSLGSRSASPPRAAQEAVPPSVSEIPATLHAEDRQLRFRPPRRDGRDARRREAAHDRARAQRRMGAPILLARTPYNAAERMARDQELRASLSVAPQMMDTAVEAGYIVAYQDVRGKHGSEGDYVMNRPLRGPLNATETDHATDTYDTIEWLVRNVPESNGRVAHDRRLLRGFHGADVHGPPAPGAQGRRAVRADGGRLDGRRLVPQRRIPRRRRARVHLQPAGDAQQQRKMVERRATTPTTPGCAAARRATSPPRAASGSRILAPARRAPGL